ncbi:hypothetical protein FNF31_01321 [Cafeteria roenbergensis]|uniref:PI3K/PI4K catalytic domain-containing protein n=1 Tax=Cafeteria roenbergensis TaxID=33653 RepID=A0A5A8DM84_CAFRO|nr:hypothetical protein FNF31_01321 [Cafeteria roenbergensis]
MGGSGIGSGSSAMDVGATLARMDASLLVGLSGGLADGQRAAVGAILGAHTLPTEKAGWLRKLGARRNLSRFRRRWFVLSERRGTLRYSSSPLDAVAKAEVFLGGMEALPAPEFDRRYQRVAGSTQKTITTFCFILRRAAELGTPRAARGDAAGGPDGAGKRRKAAKGREYLLFTDSRHVMSEWVEAITAVARAVDRRLGAPVSRSTSKRSQRFAASRSWSEGRAGGGGGRGAFASAASGRSLAMFADDDDEDIDDDDDDGDDDDDDDDEGGGGAFAGGFYAPTLSPGTGSLADAASPLSRGGSQGGALERSPVAPAFAPAGGWGGSAPDPMAGYVVDRGTGKLRGRHRPRASGARAGSGAASVHDDGGDDDDDDDDGDSIAGTPGVAGPRQEGGTWNDGWDGVPSQDEGDLSALAAATDRRRWPRLTWLAAQGAGASADRLSVRVEHAPRPGADDPAADAVSARAGGGGRKLRAGTITPQAAAAIRAQTAAAGVPGWVGCMPPTGNSNVARAAFAAAWAMAAKSCASADGAAATAVTAETVATALNRRRVARAAADDEGAADGADTAAGALDDALSGAAVSGSPVKPQQPRSRAGVSSWFGRAATAAAAAAAAKSPAGSKPLPAPVVEAEATSGPMVVASGRMAPAGPTVDAFRAAVSGGQVVSALEQAAAAAAARLHHIDFARSAGLSPPGDVAAARAAALEHAYVTATLLRAANTDPRTTSLLVLGMVSHAQEPQSSEPRTGAIAAAIRAALAAAASSAKESVTADLPAETPEGSNMRQKKQTGKRAAVHLGDDGAAVSAAGRDEHALGGESLPWVLALEVMVDRGALALPSCTASELPSGLRPHSGSLLHTIVSSRPDGANAQAGATASQRFGPDRAVSGLSGIQDVSTHSSDEDENEEEEGGEEETEAGAEAAAEAEAAAGEEDSGEALEPRERAGAAREQDGAVTRRDLSRRAAGASPHGFRPDPMSEGSPNPPSARRRPMRERVESSLGLSVGEREFDSGLPGDADLASADGGPPAAAFGALALACRPRPEPLGASLPPQLAALASADALQRATRAEAALLRRFAHRLMSDSTVLPKLVQSTRWDSPSQAAHTRSMAMQWARPRRDRSLLLLSLLDRDSTDGAVRHAAANALLRRGALSNADVAETLPQLVQSLKVEPAHASSLWAAILTRAVRCPAIVAPPLFWALSVEAGASPAAYPRFAALTASLVASMPRVARDALVCQAQLWGPRGAFARLCARVKRWRSKGVSKRELTERARQALALLRKRLPRRLAVPLGPGFEVGRLVVSRCRVLDSAKLPLWLTFEAAADDADEASFERWVNRRPPRQSWSRHEDLRGHQRIASPSSPAATAGDAGPKDPIAALTSLAEGVTDDTDTEDEEEDGRASPTGPAGGEGSAGTASATAAPGTAPASLARRASAARLEVSSLSFAGAASLAPAAFSGVTDAAPLGPSGWGIIRTKVVSGAPADHEAQGGDDLASLGSGPAGSESESMQSSVPGAAAPAASPPGAEGEGMSDLVSEAASDALTARTRGSESMGGGQATSSSIAAAAAERVAAGKAVPVVPSERASVRIIFKAGDDIRQDGLTLQLLRLMERWWEQAGLGIRLLAYRCQATWEDGGVVEVVQSADTIAAVQRRFGGGAAGAYSTRCIRDYLTHHNGPEASTGYAAAQKRFLRSLAGYCVATYALGIGDRHNDNYMIRQDGTFFHIDFGHFLGNTKFQFGIQRERSAFVLTPAMAEVLGGRDGAMFKQFLALAQDALVVLRSHGDEMATLFLLLIGAGMPELPARDDVFYVREKLCLDEPAETGDALVRERFRVEAFRALDSFYKRVDDALHILAH